MRRLVLKLLAAAALVAATGPFAGAALAQDMDPENILVIEVEGAANGTVEIQLLPQLAPGHVERIKELARTGAYDGVAFHRVIPGFMAQTGDVKYGTKDAFGGGRAGFGGSDLPDLDAEFNDMPHTEGIVSMARSQNPNSANSQFFIMFGPAPFLDGQYTVFGQVISGMEVVHEIQKGDRANNGAVAEPDYMASVKVKADL